MNSILSVSHLVKRFGSFTAVDDISFELKKGEVLGLLGPNGAGKTTTIHMLLGLTLVDSGSISYFGMDFFKHRQECLQRINFASSFNTLQGRISAYENLLVFAMLYNIKNPKALILKLADRLEITNNLNKKYWDLSAGQKTRVNLIKSLLNEPEIILMDEPTASLDPDIADKLLHLIEELKENRNLSIIYTSHDMDEVSRICDRVVFLNQGTIVAEDTPLGLTKRIPHAVLQLSFDADQNKVKKFLTEQKLKHVFINNFVVQLTLKEELIANTIFKMGDAGIWITDIEVNKPTLEDFFLQMARKK
ncbi:MAG: ABC transporter ATP-binding protein [Patescibacteria group bacterium]